MIEEGGIVLSVFGGVEPGGILLSPSVAKRIARARAPGRLPEPVPRICNRMGAFPVKTIFGVVGDGLVLAYGRIIIVIDVILARVQEQVPIGHDGQLGIAKIEPWALEKGD